jgi:hypothetical protein
MAIIVPTSTLMRRFAVETYPNSRGFISWNPHQDSLEMLTKVGFILGEYIDLLPLSIRQIFYRLVAKYDYPKTENSYNNLINLLTKARRNRRELQDNRLQGGRMLLFDAIRDDKFIDSTPHFYHDAEDFFNDVRRDAEGLRLDRQLGQERRLVIWCEAKGMVPMLERIVHPLGIPVFSCGGFDSVTAKYNTATYWAEYGDPVTIIHIGDMDPSGIDMMRALAEDLISFAGEDADIEFIRLAVTPAQAAQYNLEPGLTKPKRNGAEGYNKMLVHLSTTGERHTFTSALRPEGKHTYVPIDNPDETWQAEALDPATFASIVREAVNTRFDRTIYDEVLSDEAEVREEVLARLQG